MNYERIEEKCKEINQPGFGECPKPDPVCQPTEYFWWSMREYLLANGYSEEREIDNPAA